MTDRPSEGESQKKVECFYKGYARVPRRDILCVGSLEEEPYAVYLSKEDDKTLLAVCPNKQAAKMLLDMLDWMILEES